MHQEAKKAHLQKHIDLHSQARESSVKEAKQRKRKMNKFEKVGMMANEGNRWKKSYDGDAEEMEKVELIFLDSGGFDGDIIRLEQASFGYSCDKIMIDKINFSFNLTSRLETDVVKHHSSKLSSGSTGQFQVDGRAKIEYLANHQLDPMATPY